MTTPSPTTIASWMLCVAKSTVTPFACRLLRACRNLLFVNVRVLVIGGPRGRRMLQVDDHLTALYLRFVGFELQVGPPRHARVAAGLEIELETVPRAQQHVPPLGLLVRPRRVRDPHPLHVSERHPRRLMRTGVRHNPQGPVVQAGSGDPTSTGPETPHGPR